MTPIPPALLIPGMQCTPAMFNSMSEYLRRAVPEVRLLARPIKQANLNDAVEEALDEIGEPAILIGHSLGGTVAMAAARQFPDAVAGLALLCANPRPPRPEQISYWRRLQRDANAGDLTQVVDKIVPLLTSSRSGADQGGSQAVALCQEMATGTGVDGLIAQLDVQLDRIDERPALGRFKGPVLAVAAENDALVDIKAVREISAAAADGQFEIIQDSSHMAPLTHPGTVAAILAEWILYRFIADANTLENTTTRKVLS